MNKQLTKHFNLDEFTRSSTAAASRLDNNLDHDNNHDREVIENLRNLCTQVLEPLREFAGVPVVVTSGYRCPELNRLVGGVGNSQHLVGEAADITMSDEAMSDETTMTADHDYDHDHDMKSVGKRSLSSSKVKVEVNQWDGSLIDKVNQRTVPSIDVAHQRSLSSSKVKVEESKVRVDSLKEWFLFIQDKCLFDQLILETKGNKRWIHVSCRRDSKKNRMTSSTHRS